MLTVSNLSKSFYHHPVLRHISFTVAPGEIVAVLGKNGIGKSTLLRVLARISAPNSGSLDFRGVSLLSGPDSNRQGLLYLGHAPGMYPALSAVENLRLIGHLHGPAPGTSRIRAVLEQVGLLNQAEDPIRIYSQGMTQRLKLAVVLLVSWKLCLFDEPFSGLDIQGIQLTRSILEDCRDGQRSLLLVLHDFDLAWELSTRLLILDRGGIGADIPVAPEARAGTHTLFRKLVG